MKKKVESHVVSVRVPVSMLEILKQMAKESTRTVSQQIVHILKTAVKK